MMGGVSFCLKNDVRIRPNTVVMDAKKNRQNVLHVADVGATLSITSIMVK